MIKEEDVFEIGKFVKPHGIKGEINFAFDNDVFDRVECPYLICKIDQIFVPFFIVNYRFRGENSALISFESIDSEEKANKLCELNVYFPREYYESEDTNKGILYSWNFFIGFTVIDKNAGNLGVIKAIDDKTLNTLFLIENESREYIIPATEDFITNIDPKEKKLYLELVDGLLENQ